MQLEDFASARVAQMDEMRVAFDGAMDVDPARAAAAFALHQLGSNLVDLTVLIGMIELRGRLSQSLP